MEDKKIVSTKLLFFAIISGTIFHVVYSPFVEKFE